MSKIVLSNSKQFKHVSPPKSLKQVLKSKSGAMNSPDIMIQQCDDYVRWTGQQGANTSRNLTWMNMFYLDDVVDVHAYVTYTTRTLKIIVIVDM